MASTPTILPPSEATPAPSAAGAEVVSPPPPMASGDGSMAPSAPADVAVVARSDRGNQPPGDVT
eukprot:3057450-Alexandrium_andersonii.AAC.1